VNPFPLHCHAEAILQLENQLIFHLQDQASSKLRSRYLRSLVVTILTIRNPLVVHTNARDAHHECHPHPNRISKLFFLIDSTIALEKTTPCTTVFLVNHSSPF
jgi:hypothetical protein